MSDGYKTLGGNASAELTEKRSVFIGYARSVTTEEQALAFISEIRAKHADARHNVYAYTLRNDNTTRFSDDGEPHGTAGMPVLDVMRKEGVIDAAIVVTRYFGGILLGTGGLVRAYSAAAKAALDAAGVVEKILMAEYSVTATYSNYGKIEKSLAKESVFPCDIRYEENVTFIIRVPKERRDKVLTVITDATCGRSNAEFLRECYG